MNTIDTARTKNAEIPLPQGWPRVVSPSRDNVERLPFAIRLVENHADLLKAVQVRHAAYARHVPDFAESLREPEALDSEPGTVVLIAESRLDKTPLGTVRIQTNKFNRLKIQTALDLPQAFDSQMLAEATRLGVTQGNIGHVVKAMLFKAGFLYCKSVGVQSLIVTARKPLDRYYDSLLFKDIFQANEFFPLHYVGNLMHRAMSFSIPNAERNWAAVKHPYHKVLFLTRHPDIKIQGLANDQNASSSAAVPAQTSVMQDILSMI